MQSSLAAREDANSRASFDAINCEIAVLKRSRIFVTGKIYYKYIHRLSSFIAG